MIRIEKLANDLENTPDVRMEVARASALVRTTEASSSLCVCVVCVCAVAVCACARAFGVSFGLMVVLISISILDLNRLTCSQARSEDEAFLTTLRAQLAAPQSRAAFSLDILPLLLLVEQDDRAKLLAQLSKQTLSLRYVINYFLLRVCAFISDALSASNDARVRIIVCMILSPLTHSRAASFPSHRPAPSAATWLRTSLDVTKLSWRGSTLWTRTSRQRMWGPSSTRGYADTAQTRIHTGTGTPHTHTYTLQW